MIEDGIRPKVVRVTMTVDYFIPMKDDTTSEISGLTPEEVVTEWFVRNDIAEAHLLRDSYRVGGARRLVKTEIVGEHPVQESNSLVTRNPAPHAAPSSMPNGQVKTFTATVGNPSIVLG